MSDKQGMAIIFVGATGMGKTEYGVWPVLDDLSNMPKLIFDPAHEYEKRGYKTNWNVRRDITLASQREPFCLEALKRESHVIVFEDATGFFSNKTCLGIIDDLLVMKRHRQQVIIFCFHSLRAIPVNIFDNVNYVVIRKTGDRPSIIEQRYSNWPEIYEAYLNVDESNDKYFSEEVLINL